VIARRDAEFYGRRWRAQTEQGVAMNKLELKDVLSVNVTARCQERGFWWSDRQEANQKALERAIKQRARLNQATISRVLHGDRMTKLSTLEALAAGLNVPAWLLLVPRLSAAERA
jgi:hypothetical protein